MARERSSLHTLEALPFCGSSFSRVSRRARLNGASGENGFAPFSGTRTALAVAAAWLAPGMGHAVLGRRRLGALYAGIVTTAFVVGLSLHGQLYRFDSQHPLSLFAALTSHATGLLNLTACWMRAGEGDLRSATFEYGTTYLLVAGVMNLLLMLDAFEIARGRKR